MSNGVPNINKLVEQVIDKAGNIISGAVSSAVKHVVKQGHKAGRKVKPKKYVQPKVQSAKEKTKGSRVSKPGRAARGKKK